MFGRKPHLPHCADLTNAQLAKVHKLLNQYTHIFVWSAVEKLLKKGDHDTVLAFVQQDSARKDAIEHALIAVFRTSEWSPRTAQLALDILPVLSRYDAEYQGAWLTAFLLKAEEQPEMCVRAVEAVEGQRARGYAAADLVTSPMSDARTNVVHMLLDAGADLHVNNVALMTALLRHEQLALAEKALTLGFDLPLYADELTKFVTEQDVPQSARTYLECALCEKGGRPSKTMALSAIVTDDGYLRSGDSVSRSDQLAGGGSLTTVFNFATRQQIVIAHVAGQTSAPVITPFSQIEGDAGLLLAAEAFVLQGGEAVLAEAVVLAAPRTTMRIDKPAALPAKTPAQ